MLRFHKHDTKLLAPFCESRNEREEKATSKVLIRTDHQWEGRKTPAKRKKKKHRLVRCEE